MIQLSNLEELLACKPHPMDDGQLVYVEGYYEKGDGGCKLVRWMASSNNTDNGGTIHDPRTGGSGRWETVHRGVGDYRWFGIMDATVNADDAMDAMVNDGSIHLIEAHTDLNFVRRHTYDRSDIELNFGGHTVTTEGVELNTPANPFGAVIFFQGKVSGETQILTLSADLPEQTDTLEVLDSTLFAVDDWWKVRVKNNPAGSAQRELDYLLQITEIIDGSHVRVNYKLGWSLAAGREITFMKMNPVFRSHVRNMNFVGVPVPDNGSTSEKPSENWDQLGSNPIAYEFAVACNVADITATKVFWPVVERRYCTHYVTERCRLTNPEEVIWGGTGYLTQQLNVLYGHVRDCHTSNARHLNDFTCAGYCMVENCHGDGDEHGSFVTHGQYEHDLTFVGNSGLLSFANSGTTWGDSAKRITVTKHVGSRVVAHKRITDLTLEDVHAVYKEGLVDSGTIWANADGLQMRGCTADTMLTLSQSSSRSKRSNLADGCAFGMTKNGEMARLPGVANAGFGPVSSDFVMLNCHFHNVDGNLVGSIKRLRLTNTWFVGASPEASPIQICSDEVVIHGGGFENSGIELTGTNNQSITIDGGTSFRGANADKAYLRNRNAAGIMTWILGDCDSAALDADTAHFHIQGGSNKMRAIGSRFSGGKYAVAEGAFSRDSYMLMTACIEDRVDRSSLPAESHLIKHEAGNIIIA
ncbi:hypothetical protein GCM10008018_27040 [Paenibacillus marchantiophytorum]|uniref:Peptidase C14 n=1 Tax=Paenibacillus marchantiophytorum TaxID=1619310 RepID=A0ABQ1ENW9_9BACL|nr:peptidase C14 [Paenibacillus marchantiophytorum]GFZ80082.1 hypothetical protein GCM10008018_27040 [Paenibacillus marchantiophytorum]